VRSRNCTCKLSLIIVLLFFGGAATIKAQPEWHNFYGGVTFNGQPAPIGSVIDAYDPDSVKCGSWIVGVDDTTDPAGVYGFLAVLRDDWTTPNIDEGAVPGDTITFKVNGRVATPSATPIWVQNGAADSVDLAATGIVAITGVDYPGTQLGAPGDTVRFLVGVRNDGDGLDFYGVSAVSSVGWQTVSPDTFIYANANDTVYVYFDIIIPTFPGNDTVDNISFSVFSYLDTSQHVDSTVNLIVSISDVEDDPVAGVPSGFQLYQNYPNPFNPKTTISFTLRSTSEVTLEIYNVLGQQIHSRKLGILPAGDYDVEYDAADAPSGIYFYRLVTDTGAQVRKMVLLK